jgi:23S rRNA (adenine(2503)-C(2))-methyltransferase
VDINKLEAILKEKNQPKFRLAQVKKAVFQDGVCLFSEITALPKDLREVLDREIKILPFKAEKVQSTKGSYKALLKLNDGNFIETVLISPKPGIWSVCVSSQVGCVLGCSFCATGKMGFKRNLTAEEISSQVLFWRQYLKKNKKCDVSNIVYMGMGEPFLNWENVRESLKILIDKNLFGFGSRSISVSTAGIPEGIEKLTDEFPQINLAISLHFADNEKRSRYMGINKKYDLSRIKTAIQKYLGKIKRKIFIEYLMLDNINDNIEDADNLIKFLKSTGKNCLLHVNLIRYNETPGILKPSSNNKAHEFKDYLEKNNISVTIRKSLGEEIKAACGQLAGSSRLGGEKRL